MSVLVFAIGVLLAAACGDDSSNDETGDSSPEIGLAADSPSTDDGRGTADVAGEDAPADSVDSDERARSDDEMADDSGGDGDSDFSEDSTSGFGSESLSLDTAANQFQVDPEEEPAATGNGSAFGVAIFVGREIIFTADVIVESENVAKATSDVISTVQANGGAVWGQETRSDPSPQTVLTIRVPPGEPYARVLESIAGLEGTNVVSQSQSTDDVTEVVIDLDARITAAESSVARVQTLLDAANDLNTVFTLEEELATRQAQLERLLGQRKTIGDQITLATITLTILELDPDRLGAQMEVVAWLGNDVDDACPGVSDLSVGADDTAVLCVNINNTGEDTLTDIDVQSSTFRLRGNDFTLNQDGSGTIEALAPGEELLVYAELDADGGFIRRVDASNGLRIEVDVAATPATTPETELSGADSVFISADVDDPLPSFGEAFAGGWNAMLGVISIVSIIVGVLLPFSLFIIAALWLGRRALSKSRERAAARAAYVEAYVASTAEPTPPPPPSAA